MYKFYLILFLNHSYLNLISLLIKLAPNWPSEEVIICVLQSLSLLKKLPVQPHNSATPFRRRNFHDPEQTHDENNIYGPPTFATVATNSPGESPGEGPNIEEYRCSRSLLASYLSNQAIISTVEDSWGKELVASGLASVVCNEPDALNLCHGNCY